jgi:ribosomal protein S18 acetylase RimI-like enzyme
MPNIRIAHIRDVKGIARVHVESWLSTYKGIISDRYLSQLSIEQREKSWIWQFRHPNPDEALFVAENDKGEIIGFANGGRNRSEEGRYDAELYAIYILAEYQGQGVGTAIVRALLSHLRIKRYQSFMVWVLETNDAIGFYKRLGGRGFARKEIRIGEETLIEAALGWDRLDDVEPWSK